MKITVRVHWYNIGKICSVAKILNECGKDMGLKYNLHHWDNLYLKSLLIVLLCIMKNEIYVVSDGKKDIATFQVKCMGNALHFEKLGVRPAAAGAGYGSYCMNLIENMAKKKTINKVKMEVYDKSNHAIQFYEKRGYRKIGTDGTLKYTELVMEKELS